MFLCSKVAERDTFPNRRLCLFTVFWGSHSFPLDPPVSCCVICNCKGLLMSHIVAICIGSWLVRAGTLPLSDTNVQNRVNIYWRCMISYNILPILGYVSFITTSKTQASWIIMHLPGGLLFSLRHCLSEQTNHNSRRSIGPCFAIVQAPPGVFARGLEIDQLLVRPEIRRGFGEAARNFISVTSWPKNKNNEFFLIIWCCILIALFFASPFYLQQQYNPVDFFVLTEIIT